MALMTQVGLEFVARNRANATMAQFNRSLATTAQRLRGLATAALAAAGIGGLGYMIRQQMQVIDSTAKLSDRLRITTEALVGLQHGAQISGVQTETLNKALEIFSRRLGEVQMGTGEAERALEALGLSSEMLIGLRLDEAFKVIADRMNMMATQSEKAAAANYLFGRSGQQLLNFFEKGAEGIELMQREAEKLGLTFSRWDATQVEAANDALTRLRALFTGLARQLTIELSPYIEAAATAFVDWATQGQGVGANVAKAFEIASLSVVRFITELAMIPAKYNEIAAVLSRIAGYPLMAIPYTMKAEAIREQARESLTAIEQFYADLQAKAAEFAAQQQAAAESAAAQSALPTLTFKPLTEEEIAQWVAHDERISEERLNVIIRMYEQMGIYDDRYRDAVIQSLQAQRDEYEQICGDKVLAHQWYADQVMKLDQKIAEQQAALNYQLQIGRQWLEQVRRDWVTMWDPFIEGEKSAEEVMQDFFRQFFINLAKAKAMAAMTGLWETFAGSIFGGLGGALFGGNITAGVAHEGGLVGDIVTRRTVPISTFIGAPSYHGLAADEAAIIAKKGEVISKSGSQQPPVQIGTYIEKVEATDAASFDAQLYRSRHTIADLNFMAEKSNHPSRRAKR